MVMLALYLPLSLPPSLPPFLIPPPPPPPPPLSSLSSLPLPLSSLPLPLSSLQDNLKESRVMKKDKIELLTVRSITQLTRHPKQPHSFTLKFKGSKRIILNCDTELVCPDS